MRTHIKLLLAATTAVVALSTIVGTASARRLQVSELLVRQIWRELRLNAESGTALANCPVTLEGSFHSRTLSKVCGQLVGYITHTTVGPCSIGAARANTETLPWHIRYQSFGGILPNIERVTQQLVGWEWTIANIFTCRIRSTAEHPFVGITNIEANGQATTLEPDPNVLIPTIQPCAVTNVKFSGLSEVFAGKTGTARITLRLVQ